MSPSKTLILLALALGACPAAVIVYDVNADWSDITNPNGAWAYRQGSNLLPHQSSLVVCCGANAGITGGWAPGSVSGNFLPMWIMATGDNNAAGFLTGDIVMHSVDGANGNLGLGEANLTWTAPTAGVIDISGSMWYAHFPIIRSNDFILTLGGSTLATGTVNAVNGFTRPSPLLFGATGLSVNAGDVLQLTIQRSAGQTFGGFVGLNLTVTQTTVDSVVPEPSSALLSAAALAVIGFRMVWTRGRKRGRLIASRTRN